MNDIAGLNKKPTRLIFGILVLGSIWGLFEVAVSGWLGAAGFPYRSGLLTGIAMLLMVMAMVIYGKPVLFLGMSAVVVAVKALVVPVLHVSFMCKANSALAIIVDAAALALIVTAFSSSMAKSFYARMGFGALAALVAASSFYPLGMNLVPCAYLESFTYGSFMVKEGIIWAAFCAIGVPIGYVLGEKVKEVAEYCATRVTFTTSLTTIILCWVVSAAAIMAGF